MKFFGLLAVAIFVVGCGNREEAMKADIEEIARLRNEREKYEQKQEKAKKAVETEIMIERLKQKGR